VHHHRRVVSIGKMVSVLEVMVARKSGSPWIMMCPYSGVPYVTKRGSRRNLMPKLS